MFHNIFALDRYQKTNNPFFCLGSKKYVILAVT